MKILLAWLLLGGGLLVTACSGGSGSETLIGATCETSEECDVTGVCVVDGKDGMCTQPCTVPGGAGQCPLGSYCTREELTSDSSDKSSMVLCFPSCESQDDCRDGYSCNGVSSGPGKVCVP